MGFTHARVGIINPEDRTKSVEIELLVDTGSLYTIVPKSVLGSLGVEPLGSRRFKTADGRLIERGVGEVLTSLLGDRRHTPVAFGEEGDASVLGTTALEIFGLEVDPTTRRLRPATLLLLTFGGGPARATRRPRTRKPSPHYTTGELNRLIDGLCHPLFIHQCGC